MLIHTTTVPPYNMREPQRGLMTQKEEVFTYCEGQEGYFTLSEVYEDLSHLRRPTLRFYLQAVRDAGVITFVDNNGSYKR